MREPDQGLNGHYQGLRAPPPKIPVGTIIMYAGGVYVTTFARPELAVPTGWLYCDGRTVKRADYAALFAAIGTLYGTGDGRTTFTLPDLGRQTAAWSYRNPIGVGQGSGLTNRTLASTGGADIVVLASTEAPVHTHPIANATNLFRSTGGTREHSTGASTGTVLAGVATGVSPGGTFHDTHQPAVSVYFLIRAFDPT